MKVDGGSSIASPNRAASAAAWAFVPLFGLFSLLHGRDSGWDFRNYHWYNAYAWLTGRGEFDVAVAHHATYYNPLADVPVFIAAQFLPAWCVGFLVGCVHGLNVVLLYYLARSALEVPPESHRTWLALALAVAGTTGGMALILVGNSSNDMTMTLFVLSALLLLVRVDGSRTTEPLRFATAGLAGGMAVGLKLTMAPFAIGLAVGALVMSAPLRIRLLRLMMVGSGGFIGAALFGGGWAYTLWHQTGNPFFPYFNDIIGSPLILEASYRDERFLPRGLFEGLVYPFLFAWDGMRVNDVPFRDIKIALAYAIVPMTVLWAFIARRALTQSMRLLFATSLVSYVGWVTVFGVYRYALSLEMLAPLLIALALTLWPISERTRIGALAVIWCVILLGTGWRWVPIGGVAWRGEYVDVTLPPIPDPDRTLVVMAGLEPMGYVVPAFPPQIAFLRIDGWLDSPSSHSAYGDRMRARIDAHEGPIFAMFINHERNRAVAALDADGLMLANQDCATIRTNIGEPLLWCALHRKASSE